MKNEIKEILNNFKKEQKQEFNFLVDFVSPSEEDSQTEDLLKKIEQL